MKAVSICKIATRAALVALVIGGSYLYYESAMLPFQSTVERSVMIDPGKGPVRYGTQQEYVLNQIGQVLFYGSIGLGIVSVGIGLRLKNKR